MYVPSELKPLAQAIHLKAQEISAQYRRCESELIDILIEIEQEKIFQLLGYNSLYAYTMAELKLSESVAYHFITLARKSREVPELKEEIANGNLNISNARKIASLISAAHTDEENQTWIKKASEMSARELEREIVREAPHAAVQERAQYITPDRVKLQIGFDESQLLKLRRAQDLLSQCQKRAVTLEETISAMTDAFLEKKDPVVKAERNLNKSKVKPDSSKTAPEPSDRSAQPKDRSRAPSLEKSELGSIRVELTENHPTHRRKLPARLLHQIHVRDHGKCVEKLSNGALCGQGRWVDIHHLIPLSEGGTDILENLITLCSAHHRIRHLSEGNKHTHAHSSAGN
jgi:hypothetical protein